tara:strand:- start:198 stop:1310 length:1113 start_codon:yes stop_codon:yes gene_type:complete
MNTFLTSQIITYMGNKRKLLPNLSNVLDIIKKELNQDTITCADAFSGSGIVSRLLKLKSSHIYVNDIAGYSSTLNNCFLSNPTQTDLKNIEKIIEDANKFAYSKESSPEYIRKHWAPTVDGKISKNDRVFFTNKNALLIDKYMHFINTADYDKKYKCYLQAQLIVKCSIHNNTNGQFSAFFKDDHGYGKYGGNGEIDIKRITKNIKLEMPIFHINNCESDVSQMDVMLWLDNIPTVDILYLDPPYNKHPYSIYYFMLDIINNWDTTQEIPNTNRGQPKNWKKSDFNSFIHAENAFKNLIKKVKAKFIILSYNNKGIIPLENIETTLKTRGKIKKYPVEHKTYNKLKGIANYKRMGINEKVKEYIWVVDLR